MNYKETLYFVATCLTISLEDKNRLVIQKQLQSDTIDWDAVVKVSTAHYVFPALYCNLKRVDFLHYLPQDLVTYMEHITSLNRDRNQQIIAQAEELNSLLVANNITPIFLKGTGNLLTGIYIDIAERMVGDIDFIFSKDSYSKAIKVLIDNGYSDVDKLEYHFSNRHYPTLKKENNIAAIEIHEKLTLEKYTSEFNYSFVEKDSLVVKGFSALSYANKLNLSIITCQINDSQFYYKTISLRNAYDVYLLSKKTNAKEAVNTLHKLAHPLNCFLASCNEVFNKVDSLEYKKTSITIAYLNLFKRQLTNTKKSKNYKIRIGRYLFFKNGLYHIYKNIVYQEFVFWLLKKLINKNWYKEKLIQLGIKL